MSSNTYRQALLEAMEEALLESPTTAILGQGVTDHKGTFGTTSGLAEKFPGRVIETPIAEDSIAGISIGMALNGVYPINTHIRADFGLLAFNQLINLAAKYKYMFGGLFQVPLMMRMVVGRSWGQGAQHSQSLQALLSHIPGLVVLSPATPESIRESYRFAIHEHQGPVIMFEHRLLYDVEFAPSNSLPSHPIFGSRLDRAGSDVTLVVSSIMLLEARRAADYLSSIGVSTEIIDLHSTSHFDKQMLIESVKRTGKLVIADASWENFGVAAEIARVVARECHDDLERPITSLGMAPAPCPTAKSLEDIYYPTARNIVVKVATTLGLRLADDLNEVLSLPATDFLKSFKGPF